jgi:hypothetical protein
MSGEWGWVGVIVTFINEYVCISLLQNSISSKHAVDDDGGCVSLVDAGVIIFAS